MKSQRPLKKSRTNDFDLLQEACTHGDGYSFDLYLGVIKQDEVPVEKWLKLVWRTILLGQASFMGMLLKQVTCLASLTAKQRAEIILLCVAEDKLPCLKRLQAPLSEDGLAWSFTEAVEGLPLPLHAALGYQHLTIAAWLVAPVALKGVGLSMNKSAVVAFNRNNPLDISHHPEVQYKRSKPKRTVSSLDFFSKEGKLLDTYQSKGVLGHGKHGYARLFVSSQHPRKKLVVKSPLVGDEQMQSLAILAAMRNANREITLMQAINPDLGFYGVKHILDKQTGFYRSCLFMPYIKGKDLFECVLDFSEMRQLILLTKCMAHALHQVHQSGVVHGDATGFNMKIKQSGKTEFGIDSYRVTMLDCGHSAKLGERVGGYQPDPNVTGTAPELMVLNQRIPAHAAQDIYSLGVSLRVAVQSLLLDNEQFVYDEDADFLFELAAAMTMQLPAERLSLPEVMNRVGEYLGRDLGLRNRESGL